MPDNSARPRASDAAAASAGSSPCPPPPWSSTATTSSSTARWCPSCWPIPTSSAPSRPRRPGTLGSYALLGVLVGALAAGAVGDRIGRRKVMLVNLAWFSIGMAITATTESVATFGALPLPHRHRCRRARRDRRRPGRRVRPAGSAQPLQRDRLQRHPRRRRARRPDRDHVRRHPRLARSLLDRRPADRGAAAAGDPLPARVAEVAGRSRPPGRRRGASRPDRDPGARPRARRRGQGRVPGPGQPPLRRSRPRCSA